MTANTLTVWVVFVHPFIALEKVYIAQSGGYKCENKAGAHGTVLRWASP